MIYSHSPSAFIDNIDDGDNMTTAISIFRNRMDRTKKKKNAGDFDISDDKSASQWNTIMLIRFT